MTAHPAPDGGAAKSPRRYDLRPRRWPGLTFWLAAATALGWLWHRSFADSDVFAVYGRSAAVQGVLSHRGHLLLALTSIRLNPELALTTDHWSCPAAEADAWFHDAYTNAPERHGWSMVGYARGPAGTMVDLPDAGWTAVVVPHWLPLAAVGLAAVRHAWRFTFRVRERRRRRQGRCPSCGYDRRATGSDDRCPECGAAGPGGAGRDGAGPT